MTQSDRQDETPEPAPDTSADASSRPDDAKARYLDQANKGQLLLEQGHLKRAREVFEATLRGLGEEPSYPRAVILERLGRCLLLAGQPLHAAALFQQSSDVAEALPLTDGVKSLQGVIQSGLGDALSAAGHLEEAQKAYEAAVAIAQSINDRRAEGVDRDHLGALALRRGQLKEARAHYEAARGLFKEIGERAPEAVAWHHLGMVFEAGQQWKLAEKHFLEAARIHESCSDWGAAAQSWSHLAAVCNQCGEVDAADRWYRKAIEASGQTRNPFLIRRHLIDLARFLLARPGHLEEARKLADTALSTLALETYAPDVWAMYGVVADIMDQLAASDSDAATRAAYQAQARNFHHIQQFGPQLHKTLVETPEAPSYGRVVVLERLGRCFLMGGRPELAAAFLGSALSLSQKLEASEEATALQGVVQSGLGDALRAAGKHDEAQKAYAAALAIAEAAGDLRTQGINLDHLGALALAGGELHEALQHHQAALELFRKTGERPHQAAASHHVGMALKALERWEEAEPYLQAAVELREACADPAGAAQSRSQLAEVKEKVVAQGEPPVRAADAPGPDRAEPATPGPDIAVTIFDEQTTDCVFSTDLLIDVQRAFRVSHPSETPDPLPDATRPMLQPRTRTYIDDDGGLRFCLPATEPDLEQHAECMVMRRTSREVAVSGAPAAVSRMIRAMDGSHTVAEILLEVPAHDRQRCAELLAALAEAGVIDVSGRSLGRFVHAATKKGVLIGGGLESDDVLRLATDGNYRTYADAPRVAVAEAVPERLRALHELTRMRRSRRDYAGRPLSREDFDALLTTACGVTGTMPWEGRELKLRAYPSSGALYAVEIYPFVLRVDELEPGVYHYVAGDDMLEVVNRDLGLEDLVAAALPVERQMVAGAAAMICLVGRFRRHEHKYGEGGYRMMVAEAGHISQNLVLTATALGLTARPFGGVFDGLLNRKLGLDEAEEQFLLSVLVGHAAGGDQASTQSTPPGDES